MNFLFFVVVGLGGGYLDLGIRRCFEVYWRRGRELARIFSVTGSLIYHYYQRFCSYELRNLFLKRRPPRPEERLRRFFIQQGVEREAEYYRRLRERWGEGCVILESDPELSLEEDIRRRFELTLEHMRAGAEVICHGILVQGRRLGQLAEDLAGRYDFLSTPPVFRGEPDVLFRRPLRDSSSRWGGYIYEVADVKSSYSSKLCQQMQVVYYSYLLEDLQGVLPSEGYIITRGGREGFGIESFAVGDLIWSLRLFLEEQLWEYLGEAGSFYHLSPRCRGCDFWQGCVQRAREEGDVNLIPEMRRSQRKVLFVHRLEKLSDFAACSDGELRRLGRFPGVSGEGLLVARQHARALLERRILPRPPEVSLRRALEEWTSYVSLDEGYRAVRESLRVEDPSWRIVFGELFQEGYTREYVGVFSLGGRREWFLPLDEGGWFRWLDGLFRRYGERVLFVHYGGRMGECFEELLEEGWGWYDLVQSRVLDLKKLIRRLYCLPVSSYGLEEVVEVVEGLEVGVGRGYFRWELARWEEELRRCGIDFVEAGELEGISVGMLYRLYRERGEGVWLELLRWRLGEYVEAMGYIFRKLVVEPLVGG